ncbi:hypothetical protein AAG570_001204 [Ranatra chinensis]|uniref:Serine carboxypeptidase n=1 Tax=Ranatra chinensis TaxID=642074 RepID=A0ABD0YB75_9HEMI
MPLKLVCLIFNVIFLSAVNCTKNETFPVYFTDHIESHSILAARERSRIEFQADGKFGVVKGYSGFLTVNREFNSNLFFWYVEADYEPETAPVVVYVNGRNSSLLGSFLFHGPFIVTWDYQLRQRWFSWHRHFHTVYMDPAVGYGFSFTEAEQGYSRNRTQVGQDLYEALVQFFQVFPEHRRRDLYIAGESFDGNFAIALAYTVDKKNPEAREKLNLKGVYIDNPWIDPSIQLGYGTHFYDIGLIDRHSKHKFQDHSEEIRNLIKVEKFVEANTAFRAMMLSEDSLYERATGFPDPYNYVYGGRPIELWASWMRTEEGRRFLNVGDRQFQDGRLAASLLAGEFMAPVKPWVEQLVKNYKLLFYSGQLDALCPHTLVGKALDSIEWDGRHKFLAADRKVYQDGLIVGAYIRGEGRLVQTLLLNGSHHLTFDDPHKVITMLRSFIRDESFETWSIRVIG